MTSASSSPPIVTLTLNPALDLSSRVDVIGPTHKLRCATPQFDPGGGGINVSRVCVRLGEPTVTVAPLGGPFGAQVGALLQAEAIPAKVVPIAGATRQSITVLEDSSGDQYRFVFPGPVLTEAEFRACRETVLEEASHSRCLVVSGSLPDGVGGGLVADLVRDLPHTRVIVDTSGPALVAALRSGAHLVKPSARELAFVAGTELRTEAEVEQAARDVLSTSRIDAIVVSIGAGGAIAMARSGASIRLRAPTVRVQSTVGAGDAMVAGLTIGLHRGLSLERAAALGVAAGTAAVLTASSELCRPEDVEALLPLVVTG